MGKNSLFLLVVSPFHHVQPIHRYVYIYISEAYSEPCQTSKMELFGKIVNGYDPLTIFA